MKWELELERQSYPMKIDIIELEYLGRKKKEK
jgi:hypothetical protein